MVETFQNPLILPVGFVFILWYLRYLWQRRKLYFYSWNMPGPLGLPLIGSAYKFIGNSDAILDKIISLNGSYSSPWKIWFGTKLLVCVHEPKHVEKILTNPKCMDKDDLYRFLTYVIGPGLLTAPTQRWRKHRKLITPAFNQRILESFVSVFVEQSYIFTEVMKKYIGRQDFEISKSVSALMMDIFAETSMGLKMDIQRTDHEFSTHVSRLKEIAILRIFRVWHHLDFTWSLYPLSREYNKHVKGFHEVTLKVIREKKKILEEEKQNAKNSVEIDEGATRKKLVFMDLIMQNPEFTEEEIQDEVQVFLVAGTDTSEVVLCFLFEILGLFPEIQQKIYEEVVEILGEDRHVEASDLNQFKYMERAIKETLRLFPVGSYFLRIIGEDVDLGEYIVPKGASAFISAVNIHRNPKYWPDPLKFDPDRFLPEEIAKRPPCYYIPFSHGPRNCIGYRYALMSLKVIIATVIRKYRMFTRYKSIEDIKVKTKILMDAMYGHKVYFEHR